MGVELTEGRRYRFGSRLGVKAMYIYKSRTIRFEKKWFYSRSPKARCATLAHELWHSKTRVNAIKATRSYRVDLLLRSLLYAVAAAVTLFITVYAIIFLRFGLSYSPAGLPALIFVFWFIAVFLRYVDGGLFKKYSWPLEYDSDEASVRFIGADATREVLESLRTRWNTFTHPPISLRLKHVDEVAKRYLTPVVDFEALEREVPQEIVMLVGT